MITDSVSWQFMLFGLENFLLSSGVSKFFFFNIDPIGKLENTENFIPLFFQGVNSFSSKFFQAINTLDVI